MYNSVSKTPNVSFFRSNSLELEKPDRQKIKNKKLIAKFKKIGTDEKYSLKKSNCLATLSIGQPVHYGEQLAATLDLVSNNFKSCTFVLGDTLQRHTMKITNPVDDFQLLESSKKNGDIWLEENIHILSKMDIPWSVKRWDHWLRNENFPTTLEKIKKVYDAEIQYRDAFSQDIDDYILRLKNRGELRIDEEEAREQCLKYFQEECAVMCLWIKENCQYELYANGRTPAMEATYLRFIETIHPELLKPISLRFKRVDVDKNEDDYHSNNIIKFNN